MAMSRARRQAGKLPAISPSSRSLPPCSRAEAPSRRSSFLPTTTFMLSPSRPRPRCRRWSARRSRSCRQGLSSRGRIAEGERPFRLGPSDQGLGKRQYSAGAMDGGEQQSGDEGEMIDEEAELRLISRPTSGAVKRKGKEEDIGRGKECCFG